MSGGTRTSWSRSLPPIVAACLALGAAVVSQPGFRSPVTGRGDAPPVVEQPLASAAMSVPVRELPDFSLTTHEDKPFTKSDLEGSTWIFDFIFTSCAGPCPLMTSRMAALARELAGTPGVRLASVTVDPRRDTPEVLARYAKGHGASAPAWLFLTGDRDRIYELARKGFLLGVSDDAPSNLSADTMQLIHSTRFVLVDGSGRILGYFDSEDPAAVARLAGTVRGAGPGMVP